MRILAPILLLAASACTQPGLAVRGDSTALANREGLAKVWMVAPSLDGKRWWNRLRHSGHGTVQVFNDGVPGQPIVELRQKMVADKRHRRIATIIYDRRNKGETPELYIQQLTAAVGTLETDQFLIMPQIPRCEKAETADFTDAAARIDAEVSATWPRNTMTSDERQALKAALAPADTRFDCLHRNAKGQEIEYRAIKAWTDRHGWFDQSPTRAAPRS